MSVLHPSWALQAAIYDRLVSGTDLAALIGSPARVHDLVPERAIFPFVTLGASRVTPIEGAPGAFAHDVRLGVWSRWGGRREVRLIADALVDRLDRAPFAVEGQRLVSIRFVFADVFGQSDPDTFHGALRFRAVTEPLLQGAPS